jgi:hypothetical protein
VAQPDDIPAAVLSRDTSRDAEQMQIQAWRAMTTVEIAGLVACASRSIRALSLAGIRDRHPGDSEEMIVARYAEITLGRDLARRVYPILQRASDTAQVDDSGGS